jgi:hypothetical protein
VSIIAAKGLKVNGILQISCFLIFREVTARYIEKTVSMDSSEWTVAAIPVPLPPAIPIYH